MSKINIYIAILLSVFSYNFAYATDYNYLPPDVLIKQSEERSALEYRIRSLESQMTGSSAIQIGTLDSRINQLESERETEKNYITGLYGKNGIANQLPSALAKIDAKYANLISDLENQKSYYQTQTDQQSQIDAEIKKIQKQIEEIDKYYDQQQADLKKKYQQKEEEIKQNSYNIDIKNGGSSALEIFNILDSVDEISFDMKELITRMKNESPNLYNQVHKIAEEKYFYGKTDPVVMFNHFETLNKESTIFLWKKLRIFNPALSEKVAEIVRNKYPDGKEDNQYVGYKNTDKELINNPKIEITAKNDDKEENVKNTNINTPFEKDNQFKESEKNEEKLVTKPKSVFGIIGGFFKNLMFWK